MDLIICGGKFISCCSPPLVNEGNGAPDVVPPCVKFPIGHSTSELLSTLNTFIPSEIRDFSNGAYL